MTPILFFFGILAALVIAAIVLFIQFLIIAAIFYGVQLLIKGIRRIA